MILPLLNHCLMVINILLSVIIILVFYLFAFNFFLDKNKIINPVDNNTGVKRRPLQDLNNTQEKSNQNLEELISNLTADKVLSILLLFLILVIPINSISI